jgi:hypothetical protein
MEEVAVRIARAGDGVIEVDLPDVLHRFVLLAAEAVRASAGDPGSAGHRRLFGRIDEGADRDDPLATLARQVAIEGAGTAVERTWRSTRLTDDEAEAWLRVLSMALSLRAGELELAVEEDLDALDPRQRAYLEVFQVLQALLVEALDAPPPS